VGVARQRGAERPSRDGDVTPYERLAVRVEPVPRFADRVETEDRQGARVAFGRARGGLGRGPFEDARGEPPRGEPPHRGLRQPLTTELGAREDGEGEPVDARELGVGQLERERHACAERRPGEGALGSEGELGRETDEGLRVALVESGEDLASERPLQVSLRERVRELEERRGGGRRGEKIEVLEQTELARGAEAELKARAVEPLQRERAARVED